MAPTTYTPPINTYVPLESIVLTNAASSVTFFNIAQSDANGTYKDLVLVANATGTTQQQSYLRFNSDSGNNYSFVYMSGNGSSTFSGSGASTSFSWFYTATGQRKNAIMQIMDYSASDKHKTWLLREDGASLDTQAIAGRWANTSAITSLSIVRIGGNFESGTTLSLYALHG